MPVEPQGGGADPQGGEADPVITFDTRVALSPFDLFRALREERPPLLVDLRGAPQKGEPGRLALRGALPWPGPDWRPAADREVVLFDDDGRRAMEEAARLQNAGFSRVRALFGGLALYEFALDPEVVGEDTGLVRADG